MKKEVQGMFQGAIDTLQQKTFWKIQGLNLFLTMKKVIFFVWSYVTIIFITSISIQALQLNAYQMNILESQLGFIILGILVFDFFKNVIQHFSIYEMLPILILVMKGGLYFLALNIAFTIHITNFESTSNLLFRWFVVVILFSINKFFVFRSLSKDLMSGKKTDWVGNIDREVTHKYVNGSLVRDEISETYCLKYSLIKLGIKKNHEYGIKAVMGIGVKK
ncbi:hypothetical protein OGZ37_02785 [Lactococcus lactis]|uniref:hypothetical protein n=1 Tax=Lactococcus lactis TaxID=1358 RepID=UPI0024186C8D|nr:hypothetical protein [Lactococcus lactis]MDG4965505.1 hypothetical protein [Lactococcus lactis]